MASVGVTMTVSVTNITAHLKLMELPLHDQKEFEIRRSQFVTSSEDRKGLRYAPMAFTEQGVAMLSRVLNIPAGPGREEQGIRGRFIMMTFQQVFKRHILIDSSDRLPGILRTLAAEAERKADVV